MRATPFLPYLSVAPSAWVLPLKFSGGGYTRRRQGDVRQQGQRLERRQFHRRLAGAGRPCGMAICRSSRPNGRPLSPMTTGFTGGGLLGPGFGTRSTPTTASGSTAPAARPSRCSTRTASRCRRPRATISAAKLGFMQGIIVTPSGDVWALDFSDDKVVFMPQGRSIQGEVLLRGHRRHAEQGQSLQAQCALPPCDRPAGPDLDHSAIGDTVTRFPASDPSKVEVFPTGGDSGKGMAVDSKGNVWIANTLGPGLTVETKLRLLLAKLTGRSLSAMDQDCSR